MLLQYDVILQVSMHRLEFVEPEVSKKASNILE